MIIKKALKDKTSMNTIYPETSADQVKGIENVVAKLPTDEEGNIIFKNGDYSIKISKTDGFLIYYKDMRLVKLHNNNCYIGISDGAATTVPIVEGQMSQTYLKFVDENGNEIDIIDMDDSRILYNGYGGGIFGESTANGSYFYDSNGNERMRFERGKLVNFTNDAIDVALRPLYKHAVTCMGIDANNIQFCFTFDYIDGNEVSVESINEFKKDLCSSVASGRYGDFNIITVSSVGIEYLDNFTVKYVTWEDISTGTSIKVTDSYSVILGSEDSY